jgi:hypothetical protein
MGARDEDGGVERGSEAEGGRQIRILFLSANPRSTPGLAIDHEVRKIDEKLRAARYRDRLELISRWAVRPDDVMQALLEVEPVIVHFSGHGNQDDEILLEDDGGHPSAVGKEVLADLFGVLKDRIRLVVLNACYSRSQAEAIVEHIDGAVGMQSAFGDRAAIAFSAGFYQALAFGRSLREAFELGKIAIRLKKIPDAQMLELLMREGVSPEASFLLPPRRAQSPPGPGL